MSGASAKSPSLNDCWKSLLAKREELIKRLLAYRSEIVADREEDDEAAVARKVLIRELVRASMEYDIGTLAEVELSLHRLKTGRYGRCGRCEGKIPATLLMVLPWTHVCVACAGGGFRQEKRARENDLAFKSAADPQRAIRFQKSR